MMFVFVVVVGGTRGLLQLKVLIRPSRQVSFQRMVKENQVEMIMGKRKMKRGALPLSSRIKKWAAEKAEI
jgi:hypothetical protein